MTIWELELILMLQVVWCTTMAYSDDAKRLLYLVFTAILMVLSSICILWRNWNNIFFMEYRFRLFSCGTSKDGESFLVEWNGTEGSLKRIYQGLQKPSTGVLQFDTAKNQFLAVGDDHLIKIWDMDNLELLTTIDADGDLPVSWCFWFFSFLLLYIILMP